MPFYFYPLQLLHYCYAFVKSAILIQTFLQTKNWTKNMQNSKYLHTFIFENLI